MICPTCNATDGHGPGCPEEDLQQVAPVPGPMSATERKDFGDELRKRLNSRRDVFAVDRYMFDFPPRVVDVASENLKTSVVEGPLTETKTISSAALRLLLDYCESDWEMGFVEYCAAIFHGREPKPGETAFDLLPDVRERLSADRLGFGHIYGGK